MASRKAKLEDSKTDKAQQEKERVKIRQKNPDLTLDISHYDIQVHFLFNV